MPDTLSMQKRDRLVGDNLKLVPYVIRNLTKQTSTFSFEDLIQEGNLGLIKAAEKFNPKLGVKFSTYAVWWIKAQVWLFLDKNAVSVSVARRKHQQNRKAAKEGKECQAPSEVSLEALREAGKDFDAVDGVDFDVELLVREVLDQLPCKERYVLKERFLVGEKTLSDLGDVLGLSRERVRQIEIAALEQAKIFLENEMPATPA